MKRMMLKQASHHSGEDRSYMSGMIEILLLLVQ